MAKTQDDITRDILDKIRAISESVNNCEKGLLNEAEERKGSAVAITDDPKFGQNVLTNQIQQFKSSVEGGAQFSKVNEEDVSSCPLIYMPNNGNLVFSGVIPCLNNLKWQFSLKTDTGNGCFIWADGLILNNDNMKILTKLFGFYQNWKDSWNMEASELEKMVENLQEK